MQIVKTIRRIRALERGVKRIDALDDKKSKVNPDYDYEKVLDLEDTMNRKIDELEQSLRAWVRSSSCANERVLRRKQIRLAEQIIKSREV